MTRATTPRILIHAAIPEQAERARCQGIWIRAIDQRIAEEHDLGRLRADAATNTRAIAWILCRYTDWPTRTARPGWELIHDLTGLSESTINRAIRRLRRWGLLGTAETGSTWRTRGCNPDDREGNRGAVYVLCVPAGDEPVEISDRPSRRELEEPHARARETREDGPAEPTANLWPIGEAPQTRRDQLHASKRLRQQMPVFRDRSARYVRAILRPCFAAGWSPAQVAYALNHTPDGTAYWHTEQVRHPAAWAKARLAAWQREDGTWRTPAAQLGAGRSTDLDHRGVVAMAAADEQARATTDTTTHAATARAKLAETLRKIQRKRPERIGLGVNLPDADGRQELASEAERAVERADAGGDDWLLRNAVAARGVA